MANRQIFQLDTKTIANNDYVAVQDNGGTAEAKKVTVQNIIDQVPSDSSKLNVSDFNTYSGNTQNDIDYISGQTDLKLQSIVGGTEMSVDNTDPLNPIINFTGNTSGVSQSVFTGYTASTKSDIDYISGQTDLKLNVSDFNTYSGNTESDIDYISGQTDTKTDKNLQLKAITTTGYTLQQGDNGLLLDFSNSGDVTLTLPAASALTTGFQCVITKSAATGEVTLSGGNLLSEDSNTKLTKQFRGVTIINTSSDNYLVFGLDS